MARIRPREGKDGAPPFFTLFVVLSVGIRLIRVHPRSILSSQSCVVVLLEQLVGAADHAATRRRVEAERACVAAIGGGCLAPVAAHHDGERLTALVAAEDGSWIERRTGDDPAALAQELLAAVP